MFWKWLSSKFKQAALAGISEALDELDAACEGQGEVTLPPALVAKLRPALAGPVDVPMVEMNGQATNGRKRIKA